MLFTDFERQRKEAELRERELHDYREIAKAEAKARAVENVRLAGFYQRQMMKEQEVERRKNVYEEIVITSEGEIQIITRNLQIATNPREISNMKKPKLIIFMRMADETEKIFQIKFVLGMEEKQIFLAENLSGNGAYLLRKFASAGVYFKVSSSDSKKIVIQMLCKLLEKCEEKQFLPEKSGWYKMPNGQFHFWEEDMLTWKVVKKLAK